MSDVVSNLQKNLGEGFMLSTKDAVLEGLQKGGPGSGPHAGGGVHHPTDAVAAQHKANANEKSAAADKASAQAKASNNKEDHNDAYHAHMKAGVANHRAGNEAKSQQHYATAEKHLFTAANLRGKAYTAEDLAKGGPAAEPEEKEDKNAPSAEAKAAVVASAAASAASAKARASSRDAGDSSDYKSRVDSHVAAAEAHHKAADAHLAAGNTWQSDKHNENAQAHELAAHRGREAGKGDKKSEKLIEFFLEKGGPGSGRHASGVADKAKAASAKAVSASEKADSGKGSHKDAADAHDKAAAEHRAAATAYHHAGAPKMAAQHSVAAKEHVKQVGRHTANA